MRIFDRVEDLRLAMGHKAIALARKRPAARRFWKRSGAEARALARASRVRHWRQLDRRRRRRLRFSRAWVASP